MMQLLAALVLSTPSAVQPAPIIDSDGMLYRVTLWRDGDARRSVTIEGRASDLEATFPEARVVVTREVDGVDTRWLIDVTPSAGYGVYEVEFPLLVLKPISGASDRLLVPYEYGQVIADPFAQPDAQHGVRPRYKRAIWYGIYGSKYQTMQTILYGGGRRGAMI